MRRTEDVCQMFNRFDEETAWDLTSKFNDVDKIFAKGDGSVSSPKGSLPNNRPRSNLKDLLKNWSRLNNFFEFDKIS